MLFLSYVLNYLSHSYSFIVSFSPPYIHIHIVDLNEGLFFNTANFYLDFPTNVFILSISSHSFCHYHDFIYLSIIIIPIKPILVSLFI